MVMVQISSLIFLSSVKSDAFIPPRCSTLPLSSLSFCYSFETELKDFFNGDIT